MRFRTRGRRAWSIALALSCAVARAADLPDQLVSFGDIAERDVFLEVSINGANTSQLLRFRDAQGRLSASADALRSVGIDVPEAEGAAGSPALRLDAIPGLRYSYNAATQSVNLVVPDALRTPYQLDMRGVPRAPPATSGRGLVLNYDAYAQTSGLSRLSLYTEQRYFSPSGVFSNTGITYAGGRADRYIRYDTYWTRSDQDTMRTLRLGDTITSSLDWSRSIRIAGVQWGRNFSLRPDLVTFPVAAISASSVVPSSIALYINGVQQYSSNVPAGPSWSTRSPASPARARPPSSRATRWGAASRRRCRCTWTRACWRGACPAIRWRRASCGGGSACVRSTTTTRRPSAHRAVMAWMTR